MPLNDIVIDLSHWNKVTDVVEIVEAGIVGVIYKATEGHSFRDDHYPRAKSEAEKFGLLFGAYHFLRPGDMLEQAQWFVATAGKIDLYAADHEDEQVSLAELKDFLRYVHELTGKRAIIYSGHLLKNQMSGNQYDAELAKHRLWLAQYTTGTPTWPQATWPKWWLWQHTEDGTVPGIDGVVDRNYYDGTADKLIEEWTGLPVDDEDDVTIRVIVPSGVKVIVEEEP